MADETIKCDSCGSILATVREVAGQQSLHISETVGVKQVINGVTFICPTCGKSNPVDKELLKRF